MKKIDIPLGETFATESGVVIAPTEYSDKFYRQIENETKTACDECVFLNEENCQHYVCCFDERKDKKSVYFRQIIQHSSPHAPMSDKTKRIINKMAEIAYKKYIYEKNNY